MKSVARKLDHPFRFEALVRREDDAKRVESVGPGRLGILAPQKSSSEGLNLRPEMSGHGRRFERDLFRPAPSEEKELVRVVEDPEGSLVAVKARVRGLRVPLPRADSMPVEAPARTRGEEPFGGHLRG